MTIRYGEKGSTLSFQAQSAIFHCTAPITVAGVEPFHATFTRSELATGGGRGRGVVSVSRGPRGPMRVNNPVVPTLRNAEYAIRLSGTAVLGPRFGGILLCFESDCMLPVCLRRALFSRYFR